MKKFYLFLFVPLIVGLVICHREEVGWIAVNSEPQGAAVYLDDSLTEEVTNCVLEDVPVGEHALKLTLDGYVDWDTLVEVEPESPTTITATMLPESDTTDTTDTIPPGTLLWKSAIGSYATTIVSVADVVYFSTYRSDSSNFLSAIDGNSGELKWQCEFSAEYLTLMMVDFQDRILALEHSDWWKAGNVIYFDLLSGNHSYLFNTAEIGAGNAQICGWAASNKNTTYWTWQTDTCGLYATGQENFSKVLGDCYTGGIGSPLIDDYSGAVYTSACLADTSGSIGCYFCKLSLDGCLLWIEPTSAARIGIFCIGPNGNLYGTEDGNRLVVKSPEDFSTVWSWGLPLHPSTIVLGEQSIYAVDDRSRICAVSYDGSGLLWTADISTHYPIVGDGEILYCITPVAVVALSGITGEVLWDYECSPADGSCPVLLDNGSLVFWAKDVDDLYHLRAIKTDSKGLANSSWPKYQADNRCSGCANF